MYNSVFQIKVCKYLFTLFFFYFDEDITVEHIAGSGGGRVLAQLGLEERKGGLEENSFGTTCLYNKQ